MRAATVVPQGVLWVIAVFLAWVFFRQGAAKFSATSGWAQAFRAWHYPDGFRVAVGIAEVAAAVAVLIPRTAFAGGVVIAVIMLGGMATHVWWGHPGQVTSEMLPLVLATVIAVGRRKEFLPFRADRTST